MRSLAVLLLALALWGCQPPPPETPVAPTASLAALFDEAYQAEARDPLAGAPYLKAIEQALAQPGDPWALPTVLASVEALLWRDLPDLAGDHALVHRDARALRGISTGLRRAWGQRRGGAIERGLLASALHDLALRVGAIKAARKWRRRAGCLPTMTLIGPIGHPPLASLAGPSPVSPTGPLPAEVPGVMPFASRVRPRTVYADACVVDVMETSHLSGERALVVDVEREAPGSLYLSLTTSSAAKLIVGGREVLVREFAAGGAPVTRFAVAELPAGVTRVWLRVAQNADGQRLALQLWDEAGEPVKAYAPRPGMSAEGVVTASRRLDLAPAAEPLALASAALLAAGETRRALSALEAAPAGWQRDLLYIQALERAAVMPGNQRMLKLQVAAQRAAEGCPECWEPKLHVARVERERKGFATGIYSSLDELGVSAEDPTWPGRLGVMELLWVAGEARGSLPDLARLAFDELGRRTPGALVLADLDQRLFPRMGDELLAAACDGGTSRSTSRCLDARLTRPGVEAALREMARLRRLRGSPSIYRERELRLLLSHDRAKEAMAIYEALPPARRDLTVLGFDLGTPRADAAKAAFARDMRHTRNAPWAFEPLVRLLGVEDDPAFAFDREGAELVKRDRAKAFLPGAGTAVLRRVESYDLEASGLLHYLVYDLRRVSGTVDVAGGTWMGTPSLEGRGATRVLRRRIYKKDGRVLDPDPKARGRQGNTDLSQLETGDYVEALMVGWGLPGAHGQLTVDSPDLLPARTSVREGRVTFRRPADLPLKLWSHRLLGDGDTKRDGDDSVTTWRLDERRPRTLEAGAPPLESRVAISFGTDSYARIAAALGERYRSLDEEDPFMQRWLAEQGLLEPGPEGERAAKIVAAVGKALERPDPGALGDFVASLGGGPQQQTARWMLERGTGSRTWVTHRALRAAGLPSVIAVAEARPFSASKGFPPHTGRFTHPLLRATLDGTPTWIDADIAGPPLPPGRVSPELRGRMALLADGTMQTVDAEGGLDTDRVALDLKLAADGSATGTFAVTIHGRPAQRLADALEVVVGSDRDKMLRGVVIGWIPSADVSRVELETSAGSWQLKVRAQIGIPRLAEPSSRKRPEATISGIPAIHVIRGRPRTGRLSARYASQGERQGALAVDDPLLYEVRRRIELPPGAKVVGAPAEVAVDDPNVKASRRVRVEGGAIVDEFALNLPVGTVDVARFGAFAASLLRIDDGFEHGTRIELP